MTQKNFLLLAGFWIIGLSAFSQKNEKPFEVIAYYTGNGENLEQYPIENLTQIIFSFLHLKDDTLYFSSEAKKTALQKTVAIKKKYPGIKVLVSMGGWSACASCSPVFSKAESRENFAQSVARVMSEYGADGIDLDWEYPAIQGFPGHPFMPEDRENFTDLIIRIRKAIGPSGELSFAAGGFTEFLEKSVEWKTIMPYLNRVNLMTYDLVGGYATVTGHHTPLRSNSKQVESTDHCVQWLLKQGFPPEKFIIGAAFYARIWENVSSEDWGLYKDGKFKQGLDYKNFDRLEPDSGWSHQWDNQSMAPYAFHKTKNLFATYDNSASLYEKVKYARQYRLGGIMFWELQCDAPKNGLLQAIAESVEKTKPE